MGIMYTVNINTLCVNIHIASYGVIASLNWQISIYCQMSLFVLSVLKSIDLWIICDFVIRRCVTINNYTIELFSYLCFLLQGERLPDKVSHT